MRASIACLLAFSLAAASALPAREAGKGAFAPLPNEFFVAHLSGNQEVPPVASPALGLGTVTLDPNLGTIAVRLSFSGLGSNQTLAHIHGPAAAGANAGVLFDLGSQGSTSGFYSGQSFQLAPQQVQDLRSGLLYFNVHTQTFGGGEIRGQILPGSLFEAYEIAGAQEVPAVASAARGFGFVTLNPAGDQIRVSLAYGGLGSNQTLGHIHGPAPAGQNAAVLFNIGSSGQASGTFANLVFGVTPQQADALRQGLLYFNVHTQNFGGGEIRGQIDGVLRDGLE